MYQTKMKAGEQVEIPFSLPPIKKVGEQVENPLSSACTEKAGEQTKMPHSLPPESVPTQGVHSQSRSKDRSGSFRHKACTSSSDSNSLSDANNEIVRHPGCWLIPVKLEGIETLAVIDTGASVSMMG